MSDVRDKIFIASILSAVLYSIIFLVLRGTLVIKGGLKLTLDPNERWGGHVGINYHHFIASIARSMLWWDPCSSTLFLNLTPPPQVSYWWVNRLSPLIVSF